MVNKITITIILFLFTFSNFTYARVRSKRYGKYGKYNKGKKGNTGGSVKDAGSAKDDPNFNECKNIPGGRKLKVTLKPESTLADLISWISSITCKRYIVPSGIRAKKITIYSPSEVTVYEAYKAFLSALETMNLTIVKSGRYYKIVEISVAKTATNPLVTPGRGFTSTESLITAMIRVKYADLAEVSTVLSKFKSKYGDIITYSPTNLLIITDMANSIKRLIKMLRYLDVEGVNDEKIWVLKVKNAEASEIAAKLIEVFEPKTGGSTRAPTKSRSRGRGRSRKLLSKSTKVSHVGGKASVSKIIADERTNSLIIVANDISYLEVVALFNKLDVALPGGKEKIHIVYLENADAGEMAGLLSGLTGGSSGGRSGSSRYGSSRGRTSSRYGSSRYGSSRYGSSRGSGKSNVFKGQVTVQPDMGTNSLVIVASAQDYLSLRKIIKELDKPRRQVFVEVTIMEVSIDKSRNMGLSFHGGSAQGSGDDQSFLFGANITNSSVNSIMMNPLSLMGLAVGMRGPEIQDAESLLGIPGISFPAFGIVFQALQSNNAVNVISSPHILTTNNEKATISVGENVPFQSGISSMASMASAYTGGGMSSMMPMTSIQRQDVAIKLEITPHVNQSNFVRMEVDQEINEVKSIDPIVGPTTSKRKASTVVVVKDQQTVVIGGLITEKIKENVTKIPLLGDLPLFGYLFKSTIKKTEKTNLLIFITPYIIRDEGDLRKIFQDKLKQRKEFIEKYSAFKDIELDRKINYRHKYGLFEDINRTIGKIEEENEMKKKAMAEYKEIDTSGPVVISKKDIQRLNDILKRAKEGNSGKSVKKNTKSKKVK
jgi:general secretion pathway protein D